MNRPVRLYGRSLGNGSHAQVTRGFQHALTRAELLAGIVSLDTDDPPDTPQPGGATARHGIFTGPLSMLDAMERGTQHERRWALVAPNSNSVPLLLLNSIYRLCTDVIVPSQWAQEVMESLIDEVAVRVVPHGLHPDFKPTPPLRDFVADAFEDGHFVVAHLSTSDRQRKGTIELVRAWELLLKDDRLPPHARLDLILDLDAHARLTEWLADQSWEPQAVRLHPRVNLPPQDMARALSAAHLVCQPSRGEGFGLVPLEARACGVPVVATACTGHSEHLTDGAPGVVVVPHGRPAPIDDAPGAMAPAVTPDGIAGALLRAYEGWRDLNADAFAAAERVREQWSWEAQLAPFIRYLKGC